MNFYIIIPFIAFIINGFTLSIIADHPRKKPVHFAYIIFAGSTEFWLLCNISLWSNIPDTWLVPLLKFNSIFWLPIGFLFCHFVCEFLEIKKNILYYLFLCITLTSIVVSLTTDLVVKRYIKLFWGVNQESGLLFLPFTIVVVTIPVIISLYYLISYRKKVTHNKKKRQIEVLIVGTLVTLSIGLISGVLLPEMLGMHDLVELTAAATAILSAFIFVSIRKYQFLTPGIEDIAHELFLNVLDGVLLVDSESIIIQANNSAERIIGHGDSEIIGQCITDVLPDCSFLKKDDNSCLLEIKNEKPTISVMTTQAAITHNGQYLGKLILLRDVTEQLKAKEEIKRNLAEKELMLRETHHRIRNNLQIIVSLLDMQSLFGTETIVKDVVRESKTRIKSIALIHERLYQSENLAEVKFTTYLKELVQDIITSHTNSSKEVSMNYNLDDINLDFERAVNCGLIISEVLTNSLKHAFIEQQHPEISIELHKTAGHAILFTLQDNGSGLPHDINVIEPTTLGLQLIQSLAEQLEAKLTYTSENGTFFSMNFKA